MCVNGTGILHGSKIPLQLLQNPWHNHFVGTFTAQVSSEADSWTNSIPLPKDWATEYLEL